MYVSPETHPAHAPEAANSEFTTSYEYTIANLSYFDALARRHRADASVYRALADAHRQDPFLVATERTRLAELADRRAWSSMEEALAVEQRAQRIRAEHLIGPTAMSSPMAVIVVTVLRDRIEQTARLVLDGTRRVSRSWQRMGHSSWKSCDPDWNAHEDWIGIELADYMDRLTLPASVAAALPMAESHDHAAAQRSTFESAFGGADMCLGSARAA
ncbi:MAG: hypothetical protein ACREPE_05310 [Lysobacter sp.]